MLNGYCQAWSSAAQILPNSALLDLVEAFKQKKLSLTLEQKAYVYFMARVTVADSAIKLGELKGVSHRPVSIALRDGFVISGHSSEVLGKALLERFYQHEHILFIGNPKDFSVKVRQLPLGTYQISVMNYQGSIGHVLALYIAPKGQYITLETRLGSSLNPLSKLLRELKNNKKAYVFVTSYSEELRSIPLEIVRKIDFEGYKFCMREKSCHHLLAGLIASNPDVLRRGKGFPDTLALLIVHGSPSLFPVVIEGMIKYKMDLSTPIDGVDLSIPDLLKVFAQKGHHNFPKTAEKDKKMFAALAQKVSAYLAGTVPRAQTVFAPRSMPKTPSAVASPAP